MRSRVMPGSSPTMERRDRVSRLKSVDLPTLGRPTMARVGWAAFAMPGARFNFVRELFNGFQVWRIPPGELL